MWLAEHLRPVGEAPVTAMTFFRGEGVDTFRADLYLAAATDPAIVLIGYLGNRPEIRLTRERSLGRAADRAARAAE